MCKTATITLVQTHLEFTRIVSEMQSCNKQHRLGCVSSCSNANNIVVWALGNISNTIPVYYFYTITYFHCASWKKYFMCLCMYNEHSISSTNISLLFDNGNEKASSLCTSSYNVPVTVLEFIALYFSYSSTSMCVQHTCFVGSYSYF